MIDAAITHIAERLDDHLLTARGDGEEVVVVSDLVASNDAGEPGLTNRLALFLVNIEHDSIAVDPTGRGQHHDPRTHLRPTFLNLHLMIASTYGGANYLDGLTRISQVIDFFQAQPTFDQQSPSLDPRIDRLTMEIENLNMSELSGVWSVLGGRYVPSVLYKMRLITFPSEESVGRVAPVINGEPTASPGS